MIGEEGLSFVGDNRKVNGEISVVDPQTGGQTYYATAQCKHCGIHWQVVPGSGRIRSFCLTCVGLTCGKESCVKECVPYEAQIEIMEGKKSTIEKYKGNDKTLESLGLI